MKKLLELKKNMKSKLPTFSRKDSHKKAKLGDKWRRPKGLQNKMRLQKRAHKKIVKTGYGTPADLRDRTNVGLRIVNVSTKKEIETITKEEAVVISSKVSKKTLVELLEFCESKKVFVENIKDVPKKIKEIKDAFTAKKLVKNDKLSSRTAKKAALDKKSKAEKDKAEKAKAEKENKNKKSDDKLENKIDDKDKEKKEKDKILTKKL